MSKRLLVIAIFWIWIIWGLIDAYDGDFKSGYFQYPKPPEIVKHDRHQKIGHTWYNFTTKGKHAEITAGPGSLRGNLKN
jgi:hypothetical protein